MRIWQLVFAMVLVTSIGTFAHGGRGAGQGAPTVGLRADAQIPHSAVRK